MFQKRFFNNFFCIRMYLFFCNRWQIFRFFFQIFRKLQLTSKKLKGCIQVACRFFRGFLKRFFLEIIFMHFLRSIKSDQLKLLRINYVNFFRKKPLKILDMQPIKNLSVFQKSMSICEKFEKKISKICHRLQKNSYILMQKKLLKNLFQNSFF